MTWTTKTSLQLSKRHPLRNSWRSTQTDLSLKGDLFKENLADHNKQAELEGIQFSLQEFQPPASSKMVAVVLGCLGAKDLTERERNTLCSGGSL